MKYIHRALFRCSLLPYSSVRWDKPKCITDGKHRQEALGRVITPQVRPAKFKLAPANSPPSYRTKKERLGNPAALKLISISLLFHNHRLGRISKFDTFLFKALVQFQINDLLGL